MWQMFISKNIILGLILFCLIFILSIACAGSKTYTNSIGMKFILIPAGSFMMGCNNNFEYCDSYSGDTPRHRITISKPFYMGKYEVTQDQWVSVMGSNPSKFKSKTNPVEQVSWDDVQIFIHKLNQDEGTKKYRLPTEAEWEYACRAGTITTYFFGDEKNKLGQYVWFNKNSGRRTHSVGQLKPNAWGLYDMHGNVDEWCQDGYSEDYYARSPSIDPKGGGAVKGRRFLRGGSWSSPAGDCRSASRVHCGSLLRDGDLGFRLVLSPCQ